MLPGLSCWVMPGPSMKKKGVITQLPWKMSGKNPPGFSGQAMPQPFITRRSESGNFYQNEIKCSIESKRSEEHTSELQSLMRISYAVYCLKNTTKTHNKNKTLS